MAASQWENRYGQPETQGLAPFKSPDKTSHPRLPIKGHG